MRTRKEIKNDTNQFVKNWDEINMAIRQSSILEVLLDIRELLANPPVEVSGAPLACLTRTKGGIGL